MYSLATYNQSLYSFVHSASLSSATLCMKKSSISNGARSSCPAGQREKLTILPRDGMGFWQVVPSRVRTQDKRKKKRKKSFKKKKKNHNFSLFLTFFWQSGGDFVPGQRYTGTWKYSCPGTLPLETLWKTKSKTGTLCLHFLNRKNKYYRSKKCINTVLNKLISFWFIRNVV